MSSNFNKRILEFASATNTTIRNCGNELRHGVITEAQKTLAGLVTEFSRLPETEQQRHQHLIDETRAWLSEQYEREQQRLNNATYRVEQSAW